MRKLSWPSLGWIIIGLTNQNLMAGAAEISSIVFAVSRLFFSHFFFFFFFFFFLFFLFPLLFELELGEGRNPEFNWRNAPWVQNSFLLASRFGRKQSAAYYTYRSTGLKQQQLCHYVVPYIITAPVRKSSFSVLSLFLLCLKSSYPRK